MQVSHEKCVQSGRIFSQEERDSLSWVSVWCGGNCPAMRLPYLRRGIGAQNGKISGQHVRCPIRAVRAPGSRRKE